VSLSSSYVLYALLCGALPGQKTQADEGPPYEIGVIPVVAYDSSSGTGFGVISNLAHFRDGLRPYDWRLRFQSYTTVKEGPDGESEFPLQHHYLKLDMPEFLSPALRSRLVARYRRRTNAGFFGLGNRTELADIPGKVSERAETAFRYHQYDVEYAELSIGLRYNFSDNFDIFGDIKSWYAEVLPYANSLLASSLTEAPILGVNRHGVGRMSFGVLYDSRDNETTPTKGFFHEISMRGAKNVAMDGAYGGVNLTARAYYGLYNEYLVLAGRLMLDGLIGDAPIYILGRHGGLYEGLALGDSHTIRGIPNGRYHGKIKAIANLELRSKIFHYSLLGTRNNVGVLMFVDSGRVWADWTMNGELDGEGLGLKYGVGGGLRLQFGRSFIVRADTAWSPDGRGTYINVNHIF
jgi:outer membrane protein assembly factor BamA